MKRQEPCHSFEFSSNDGLGRSHILGLTYQVHYMIKMAKVLNFNYDHKVIFPKDVIYILNTFNPVKLIKGDSLLPRKHVYHRYSVYGNTFQLLVIL